MKKSVAFALTLLVAELLAELDNFSLWKETLSSIQIRPAEGLEGWM